MICAAASLMKQTTSSTDAACFLAVYRYVHRMSDQPRMSNSGSNDAEFKAQLEMRSRQFEFLATQESDKLQLLARLARGDPVSWNEVFDQLYPVAFESARSILGGKFESDCEDVAMETFAELIHKVESVSSVDEFRPLTAAIARNKSKDLLRRRLTDKRGGNRVQSLDMMIESRGDELFEVPQADFLDSLTLAEVRELLTELSQELKKEYRLVLKDHFFDHLSHFEIANKRKIAVGSVGKYLQRGISCLREIIARRPKLQNELRDAITDNSAADVLLPLVSAVQLKPYNPYRRVMFSLREMTVDELERQMKQRTDEEILQAAPDELPEVRTISTDQRSRLNSELKAMFPDEVGSWSLRQKQIAKSKIEFKRANNGNESSQNTLLWIVALALIFSLALGLRWLAIKSFGF